jgi:hypothetical protein
VHWRRGDAGGDCPRSIPVLSVFLGLLRQDTRRLIALQAGILIPCGIDRVRNLVLIGRFLVVGFTRDGRAKIDHFSGGLIDQQDVLVGLGLLLAAGVRPLLGGLDRTLPAAFGPIDGSIRCPFPRQRVLRPTACIACWPHAQVCERLLQDGEQTVHPGIGLGWAQVKR